KVESQSHVREPSLCPDPRRPGRVRTGAVSASGPDFRRVLVPADPSAAKEDEAAQGDDCGGPTWRPGSERRRGHRDRDQGPGRERVAGRDCRERAGEGCALHHLRSPRQDRAREGRWRWRSGGWRHRGESARQKPWRQGRLRAAPQRETDMVQFSKWKIATVLAIILIGVITAIPNLFRPETLAAMPSFFPKNQVNLGLDLQGGSHLLLEVDLKAL